jgi:hypothetical protein
VKSQITQSVSDYSLFDSYAKSAYEKHVSNGCASFAEIQKVMDKSLDISWCEQLATESVEIFSTRSNRTPCKFEGRQSIPSGTNHFVNLCINL